MPQQDVWFDPRCTYWESLGHAVRPLLFLVSPIESGPDFFYNLTERHVARTPSTRTYINTCSMHRTNVHPCFWCLQSMGRWHFCRLEEGRVLHRLIRRYFPLLSPRFPPYRQTNGTAHSENRIRRRCRPRLCIVRLFSTFLFGPTNARSILIRSTFTGAGGRDLKGTKQNPKNVGSNFLTVSRTTNTDVRSPIAPHSPTKLRPVL